MKRILDQRSVVAIDPNSRGLAFVFFEGGILLDWGTRRKDGAERVLLKEILDRCKADVLVLEDADAVRSERRLRMRRLLRLMEAEAIARGVTVLRIGRYAVRQAWAARGMRTKHTVAAAIGGMFPEIEPLVPRKRKVYRSEATRTDIFDAISLVIHAFGVNAE